MPSNRVENETEIDKLNNARGSLLLCSDKLEKLSNSFYNTGNIYIGDKLAKIAEDIVNADEIIGKQVFAILDREFKTAETNSAIILKAVLAGAELTKNKKEK